MEDKLTKQLIDEIKGLRQDIQRQNKLTEAVLKASGHHPNYQQPVQEQRRVDPLTALIERGAQ